MLRDPSAALRPEVGVETLTPAARSPRGYLNGSSVEAAGTVVDASSPPSKKPPEVCRAHILIVEDNELSLKLLNDVLEYRGHTIISTSLGAEAVELARRHRPDLIFLDIQLPDIPGTEVAARLKADPEVRAI